ncbi:hypothetical protein GLE_0348 [Lysobacter enzymogenes]|uniref:Uncharacterized protein n=1 Tax=Lysobacter enzymogenes TaxID=69 RepID=A0A0S2DB09_LYSEN|nr:hypothetical protein GLE_0348 [Lysobacter enzymogenes]
MSRRAGAAAAAPRYRAWQKRALARAARFFVARATAAGIRADGA